MSGIPQLPVLFFGDATPSSLAVVADQVLAAIQAKASAGGATLGPAHRAIVLVDGSAGSGKSTFAHRLAQALPGAAVVPVDDISWWLHPIDWVPEMQAGVIEPWLSGNDVDYRPPGWIAKGREGSVIAKCITNDLLRPNSTSAKSPNANSTGANSPSTNSTSINSPSIDRPGSESPDAETSSADFTDADLARGSGLLIIEGVGAGRRELAPDAAVIVWVNANPQIAEDRRIERDLATGVNGTTREQVVEFEKEWMANEVPFHLKDKPWERADLIIAEQPAYSQSNETQVNNSHPNAQNPVASQEAPSQSDVINVIWRKQV